MVSGKINNSENGLIELFNKINELYVNNKKNVNSNY